jgi:hypothetical protein
MTKARVTPTSKTDWRRYLKQRGILTFAEDNCLSRTTGTHQQRGILTFAEDNCLSRTTGTHHILHCCARIRGPNYKENIGQKTHYKLLQRHKAIK